MRTPLASFNATTVLDAFAESVCITDAAIDDPRILYVNPAFEAMTGYAAADVIGRNPKLMQGPDTDRNVFRTLRRTLAAGRLWRGTAINYRKDGTQFVMEWSIRPLQDTSGRYVAFLALQRDITDRHRASRRLERGDQTLRGILRLPVTTFRLNRDGRVVEAAGAGLERFALADRCLPAVFPELQDEILTALQGGSAAFEAEQLGRVHQVYLDHDMLEGAGAIGFSIDITDRKAAETRARDAADFCPVTRLLNAGGFEGVVGPKIGTRTGAIGTVALMRIADYDTLLSTLGAEDMVELERALARRLRAELGATAILARLYEGSYAIALSNTPGLSADATLSALLDHLSLPFLLGDLPISIQAAVGVARHPEDGSDIITLLAAAKIAVNHAGRRFGARLCRFEREMQDSMARARRVADRLRLAIARRHLSLVFQPKVKTATGLMHGVEALVRWQDAELGTVTPGEFIPIAETSGLIVPLGEWVALEAIETQRAWADAGVEVTVAINISAEQLRRQRRSGEFRDFLLAAMADAGLPTSGLELELTESSFADTMALDEVGLLSAAGFPIVVDDFGKDHSTLGLLQSIPAGVLKVDKQFVDQVIGQDSQRSRFLLEKIVELGKGLGMDVVAEGVETDAQMRVLTDLGCDHVQGFLFARPMEAADIPALLQRPARAEAA
ncbi:MAG: phosphodiesterase [Alphaproteobacteria bacterium]|nr:MAG: phosphodiesterase [Alphaproteobacteria bacterium]